jgi:glucosamine--fructose-6-phosphate aminotransferase (isomerizing)
MANIFFASDATPIIEHTNRVVFLNDNDVAIVQPDQITFKTIMNVPITPTIQELDMDIGEIEKGGFDHFMLKEIFEQPRAIEDTIRGRISIDNKEITLGGLYNVLDKLINAKRIIIIGCGTSWHAGLVGEYLLEDLARIPVEVEYASEFRYRNPVIFPDDILITICKAAKLPILCCKKLPNNTEPLL